MVLNVCLNSLEFLSTNYYKFNSNTINKLLALQIINTKTNKNRNINDYNYNHYNEHVIRMIIQDKCTYMMHRNLKYKTLILI